MTREVAGQVAAHRGEPGDPDVGLRRLLARRLGRLGGLGRRFRHGSILSRGPGRIRSRVGTTPAGGGRTSGPAPGVRLPRIADARAPVQAGTVAVTPCVVRNPSSGEGVRLLAVGRQAQLVDPTDVDRWGLGAREVADPAHQPRVPYAATGDDQLADLVGATLLGDDAGGELGERGHQVVGGDVGTPRQPRLEVARVEQLLAGRLRCGQRVVRLVEQGGQQVRVDPAGRGVPALVVVRLVEEPPAGEVDQGVGGAEVVRENSAVGPDQRHVGDAAEVERGLGHPTGREQQHVEDAHQWRTLPAPRDVAGAQVGDDGHAGAFGDPGGLAELEGAAGPALLDPVEDRLAVGHDQVRPAASELGDTAGGGRRERLSEQRVESADVVEGDLGGREYPRDQVADLVVVGLLQRAERRERDLVAVERQVGRGHVDPVVRRAGHQADHPGHVGPPSRRAPSAASHDAVMRPSNRDDPTRRDTRPMITGVRARAWAATPRPARAPGRARRSSPGAGPAPRRRARGPRRPPTSGRRW